MSRRTSPSTHRPYGIARVLRVWALPRSSFYAQRARRAHPAPGRRGRTPVLDDVALLAEIRAVIAESPFHGEGHRKIWARLRALKGVRTSMRRVLRVMRDAELLAPARQPATRYDTSYWELRQVSWDAYIEVRGNRYSVPDTLAGRRVSVRIALDGTFAVYDGEQKVAQHRLRPASDGWVTVPEHHRAIWEALQVERRPLTIYEEVGQWN